MKSKPELLEQINAVKERIAKERDELRELLAELNQIAEDCDEAEADLERAADALSRLL